jgi:uncharacterized protein YegP (UPF0339 family)
MRTHKLTLYRDKKKQWRWRFTAPNGRITACSGEGYKRKADCLAGFYSLYEALANNNMKLETIK